MLRYRYGIVCFLHRTVRILNLHSEFSIEVHDVGNLLYCHVALFEYYAGCQDQVSILYEIPTFDYLWKVNPIIIRSALRVFIFIME